MKSSNYETQTFREKLYAGVDREHRARVDELLTSSIRGSDRIEGIYRSRASYAAGSPRDLPRVPRDER